MYSAADDVIATSNTGKLLNAWRHVKIIANGSSIKVYVDGVLQINATDGTYTKGYFGLNVFGVAARYDNLTVNGNPFKNEVYYVRDVDGEVLAEYDGGGNLLAEYVSGNGQRIAKINPTGTVDFYLNDHLGSARAMVGSGWSANYYPFGELASQTGSDEDTRYDFTGKERDRGTGLMYFGARYYDPEIGRFISVDRFADKYPSLTPYQYAANNPLKFIDVNGDTLDLAGDREKALQYLRSLVSVKQGERITVDEKGRVSFNTKDLDLSSDAALTLLNNLINGETMFLFEVAEQTTGILRSDVEGVGKAGDIRPIDLNTEESAGIANLSITPRNINGGVGSSGLLPKAGYQGQVSLGPGNWTYSNSDLFQMISNIVFHELSENYHRTVNKEPYIRPDLLLGA